MVVTLNFHLTKIINAFILKAETLLIQFKSDLFYTLKNEVAGDQGPLCTRKSEQHPGCV